MFRHVVSDDIHHRIAVDQIRAARERGLPVAAGREIIDRLDAVNFLRIDWLALNQNVGQTATLRLAAIVDERHAGDQRVHARARHRDVKHRFDVCTFQIHRGQHVIERQHFIQLTVRQRTLGDIGTNARVVVNRHVRRSVAGLIRREHCIDDKVAGRVFAGAASVRRVRAVQIDQRLTDGTIHRRARVCQQFADRIDDRLRRRRLVAHRRHRLVVLGVIDNLFCRRVDRQFKPSHVLRLVAGVNDDRPVDEFRLPLLDVRVRADDHSNARYIRRQRLILIDAFVREHDHQIGFTFHFRQNLLQRVLLAHELELLQLFRFAADRRRARISQPDDAEPNARDLLNDIGLDPRGRLARGGVQKIRGKRWELRFARARLGDRDAVIEIVIAQRDCIVADRVHRRDNRFTLIAVRGEGTLPEIAAVERDRIRAGILLQPHDRAHGVDDTAELERGAIAARELVALQVSVHVVRVQDRYFDCSASCGRRRGGRSETRCGRRRGG